MERRKKIVRIVCIALACLMALTLAAPLAAVVFAEDPTPAEKLEQAKKELEAIEGEIEDIENSKAAAQKSKAYYEELANAVKTQIEAQNNLITAQQESINQKQKELEAKITEVESTQALFDERMKTMYVQHNRSSLSVLLGVTSFAEALRYIQNLQYIAQSDTDLINTLRTQKEELDAQIAELDAELAGPRGAEAAVRQQRHRREQPDHGRRGRTRGQERGGEGTSGEVPAGLSGVGLVGERLLGQRRHPRRGLLLLAGARLLPHLVRLRRRALDLRRA